MITKKKRDIQMSIFGLGVSGLFLSLWVCFVMRLNGPNDIATIMPLTGYLWFSYCVNEVLKLKYKEETE